MLTEQRRHLAVECIEYVVYHLPPKQRFHVATDFELVFIQKQCLAVLECASIEHASRKGQCDLLDFYWHHRSTLGCVCSNDAIDFASQNGHVTVLEWWWKKGETPYFQPRSCNFITVSRNGHVAVLQWWKDQVYDTLRTYCDREGWFIRPLLYAAAEGGHVDVLEWWIVSGLINCDWCHYMLISCLVPASVQGYVAVLQWIWDHIEHDIYQHDEEYQLVRKRAIGMASRHGHVAVLQWFKANDPQAIVGYADSGIQLAQQAGHDTVVDWWIHEKIGQGSSYLQYLQREK